MTDVASVKAHTDAPTAPVVPMGGLPTVALPNGFAALDGTIDEEDSSVIKCICGFADDDGNTVLCEKCDTWQHIVCYYESNAAAVPDVHLCVECFPRPIDRKGAADRQRMHRDPQTVIERKGRPRNTTTTAATTSSSTTTTTNNKSHKKRVKEPSGSVQPNGWPAQPNHDVHHHLDRKSGSPRDQPPPAKRPKTSHRSSASVSAVGQAPSLVPAPRRRGGSVMVNGHSPVKSPVDPPERVEEFSLEFMHLYRQPEPPSIDVNSYTDLRVTNEIASWFNDRDALAEATGGMMPAHVFQRIDQSIDEMEASHAPAIAKQTEADPGRPAHGLHPQWHYLVVESPVANGGFIGELKGCIGMKQDYFADPANRWDLLRHPEPFVFFPPHLPIYIDTRHEGSKLRYARRSCNPNMVMKILTQGTESRHHFCFLATRDIEPGEELTIGWDIDSAIRQQLEKAVTNGEIKKEGFKKIQPWVATVLANFGGCACDASTGHECLLERARRNPVVYAEPAQILRSKGKRSKKPQISPTSTGHATNSRAGSEAFLREPPDNDEAVDARSTSGSRKSSSRDITPATHFSVDEGKMSERERRKLQQQERLFEQLEHDEQHKGKRGKRNSAGSALNTPGLSTSKQLGPVEHSPSMRNAREHSNGVARKTSSSSTKVNGRSSAKPRPVYVDCSTQTEGDRACGKDTEAGKQRMLKPPLSFKRKLLQQAQRDRLRRDRAQAAQVKVEAKSPGLDELTSSKPSPVEQGAPSAVDVPMDVVVEATATSSPAEPSPSKARDTILPTDADMADADESVQPKPLSPKVEPMPDAPPSDSDAPSAHPPIQPPPPPWPSNTPSETMATVASPEPEEKRGGMHLVIPVKPEYANPTSPSTGLVTPNSVASVLPGSAIAESPVSATPGPSPFSPAVTHAVAPGPARKKLSLSAYTSRRAKLAQQTSITGGTPPLAQSQSVSSPTPTNASLPDTSSSPGKAADAADEDKMPVPLASADAPATVAGQAVT